MFLVTAFAVLLGTAIQYLARLRGIHGFNAAREAEDELQKHYSGIASGAKELRISRPRRQRMFGERIQRTADYIRDTHVRSINIFVIAKSLGSMLFFVVIGLLLVIQQA